MSSKKQNKILILGVGGTGMNVLAQFLVKEGHYVYGVDRYFDVNPTCRMKKCLEKIGIQILKETEPNVKLNFDLVIKSPAIENTNPHLSGLVNEVPVKTRSEYLLGIFNSFNSVGITGTSGKTTITGMLSFIVNYCDKDYFCLIGDEIINWKKEDILGNYHPGNLRRMIFEVDESEGSLSTYFPEIGLISTIDKDHYSIDELLPMYDAYCQNSKILILNIDNPYIYDLWQKYSNKAISISMKDKNADYYYSTDKISSTSTFYTVNGVKGSLNLIGSHNVLNSTMALASACKLGFELKNSMERLADFKGINRRFEIKQKGNSYFVLDFAHNIEKIRASINCAKSLNLPLIYLFQPHGYGPLKFMLNDLATMFKENLTGDDILIVKKIYDPGGSADRSVQSSDLINLINLPNALYMENDEEVYSFYNSKKSENFIWVITGARDPGLQDLFDKMLKM